MTQSPSTPQINRRLAARMELTSAWRGAGYCQAIQRLRPQAGSQVLAVADGLALYAGAGYPVNAAIGLGMSAPVEAQDILTIEQFYANHGLPACIDLCPLADPSLNRLLDWRGFRFEHIFTMLVTPLPGYFQDLELPPGVTVTVASEDQADLWVRTTAQGFSEEDEPSQSVLDVLSGNFYAPNGTCFLAWVDDQPAGGAGMYIHAGAVELGGASTRRQFRRRGVHTALLDARLAAAQAAGCDLAVVQTSPTSDSKRNLERHGFLLAYNKEVFILDKNDNRSFP